MKLKSVLLNIESELSVTKVITFYCNCSIAMDLSLGTSINVVFNIHSFAVEKSGNQCILKFPVL